MVLVLAPVTMVKVMEAVIVPREVGAVPVLYGHTFSFWPIDIISPVVKRMQISFMNENEGEKGRQWRWGAELALSPDPDHLKCPAGLISKHSIIITLI